MHMTLITSADIREVSPAEGRVLDDILAKIEALQTALKQTDKLGWKARELVEEYADDLPNSTFIRELAGR